MNKPITKIEIDKVSQILNPEKCMEIIQGLYQGRPLLGKEGLLTSLIKDFTEIALQGEMEGHLLENKL